MAAYSKFNVFVEHLMDKVHDLMGTTDTTKCYLSNTAPDAEADAVKADLAEISAGNGYTAGGEDTQNSGARSTTTFTLTGTKIVWTASGGTIGPFQYVVHYNDTPTSPADPLINWWNHGSAVTLASGETFTLKFNNSDTTGTIFTLS